MSTRRDLTFTSHGAACAAWLYEPDDAAPGPVIVMAHGLGAVREMGLDAFAERFTAAGYRCLVFDYRHFGASEGRPRQLLSIGRQRQDWHAALSFATSLPDVTEVVAWGTSFSGGHVTKVASQRSDLAAVVAQCPFTDGIASLRAVPLLTMLKLTVLGVLDLLLSLIGRGPRTVPIAGKPGDTALMTAEDVVPGYLGLVPDDVDFTNEAAARIGLAVGFARPGIAAKKVTAPALFCLCRTDSVAPFEASRKHLSKAPNGRIVEYDEGHFDIYVAPAFDQVVADQLAFLTEVVPVRT